MRKSVLIQSPSKFAEVVPIYCSECLKHGIFDHIYIVTDADNSWNLDSKCQIIKMSADRQFASNILHGLKHVEEEIFLLCCEDHIMLDDHDPKQFKKCFQFMKDNPSTGQLRLTCHDQVKFAKKRGFISELHPQYEYLTSLQPSLWRRGYCREILRSGEDAWQTEVRGSKRARKNPFRKFCVTKTVYHATNFYKSGQYIRHYFADYAKEHEIDIQNKMDIFEKKKKPGGQKKVKKVISFEKYMS